jgi:hypothetical protein
LIPDHCYRVIQVAGSDGPVPGVARRTTKDLVLIADLVAAEGRVIHGKVFIDQEIIGPAAIRFGGTASVTDNQFLDGPRSFYLAVPGLASAGVTKGLVIFDSCIFRGCVFNHVTIVGTLEERDHFFKGSVK